MDNTFENESCFTDIFRQTKQDIGQFIKRICHFRGLKCQKDEFGDIEPWRHPSLSNFSREKESMNRH